MRLSVAIQHHPDRAELLPGLLAQLDGLDVEVVTDPDPYDRRRNAWRCYRHALETTPDWATHRLILQDDVKVCSHFGEVVEQVIAACECRIVCLCVCHEPSETARLIVQAEHLGQHWVGMDTSRWLPAIANVWPTSLIPAALAFVDEQNWPAAFTADDEIIGRIASGLGVTVSATVPSIVHHDDMVESVAGQKAAYGENLNRVTCRYIGDEDARRIAW